ncbi:hypothetical protein LSUE1_G005720 [Lachnellula suecica]|uniref:Uncharacterized protein n=1 Tax=Lachnellula suecica TaxID=602035 RepID=A0A8T9CAN9_9HELO|nr:hypothetical protein LSUE1_G005720 [Lachnellula suecica]
MNASNMETLSNCSSLASRSSFIDYVEAINTTTSFNTTLLYECQGEICNALWGDGNADISGIGMVVGYIFESVLGLIFILGLALKRTISRTRYSEKYSNILVKGCNTFFDCAVFFTVSIQISCVVVLVRRDLGINANGLGGLTTQITWVIALLCMLSLIYPLVILDQLSEKRGGYRLFLFCGCWVLFCYTFISQMIGEFAPSQVGQGAGQGGTTIITTDEWNSLTDMCFSGVQSMRPSEARVLRGFGAMGSLVVTTYGVVRLLWFIGERQWPTPASRIRKRTVAAFPDGQRTAPLVMFWVVLLTILTIPQYWGLFRLRNIQKSLANSTSNAYADNQWAFGQVVAVTIFAPVFTEIGYLLLQDGSSVTSQASPKGNQKP